MTSPTTKRMTAMLVMAVFCLALGIIGCVQPRHIEALQADIDEVKLQNQQTQDQISQLEKTLDEDSQSNSAMRNDINVTVSELREQIAMLLENYNQLMYRIDQLSANRGVLRSSTSTPQTQSEPTTQPVIDQPVTTPVEPSIDCGKAYDDAFILVRRGEYQTAIDSFNVFLNSCPQHESTENAYYWIGECYYFLEKYVDAVDQFNKLLDQFKSSPNLGRALYKLGRSYQELGKKEDARKNFQRLVDEFDGTLEADQARERLKEL